jgi:transcription termination factor NusB
METSRNSLHEKAMVLIYDALTYQAMGSDYDIKQMMADYLEVPYDETDIFLKEVTIKALVNQQAMIEDLQKNMKKWKFSRLNRLMQAILLMSVAHFRYVQDAEKNVIIDIAVKLSKKYLDDGDYKFVNAILDASL